MKKITSFIKSIWKNKFAILSFVCIWVAPLVFAGTKRVLLSKELRHLVTSKTHLLVEGLTKQLFIVHSGSRRVKV